jgi:hypothetical protein
MPSVFFVDLHQLLLLTFIYATENVLTKLMKQSFALSHSLLLNNTQHISLTHSLSLKQMTLTEVSGVLLSHSREVQSQCFNIQPEVFKLFPFNNTPPCQLRKRPSCN